MKISRRGFIGSAIAAFVTGSSLRSAKPSTFKQAKAKLESLPCQFDEMLLMDNMFDRYVLPGITAWGNSLDSEIIKNLPQSLLTA